LTLLATAATAQAPFEGDGPWVFRAYGASEETLRDLSQRFDHIGVFPAKDMVLVHADGRADLEFLQEAGLQLEVDADRTAVFETIAHYRARGIDSITGIPGFGCYRTVEETLATGAAIADQHPDLATWIDVGDSWEKINTPPAGFDLQVLRLTNSAIAGDKPALMVTGSTHAREYATAELVTRFAETLVEGYGVDPDITWILDHHEIHLLLMTNPDGRKQAETGLSWRKNANNDFCANTETRGIDLNRNFDFEWGCCGGSSTSACSLTFRGPSAASEPEAQAVQAHMEAVFPDQRPDDLVTPAPLDAEGIYLDIHSFGQIVLSPWSFQSGGGNPPNGQGLLTLARKYAFFPNYNATLGSFGIVDGSTKDYAYGHLGVPGYTVELGTSFFEDCSFFEANILPGNLAALQHIAKNVRTPYVTPSGPDTIDPAIPPLPVAAGQLVELTATLDDTRHVDTEPSQNILGGEVYVSTPPWLGGSAIAMTAADGAFNTTVEDAEAAIDTTGLAPGRHTLFVRGQDSTTTFGAVSAEFLYVIDPAVAPTFDGSVRDASSGDPLAATLILGAFEITTDPVDGSFSQQLPSATYDVEVTAPGYAPETLAGLVLADSQTATRDVLLLPLAPVFADDAESGNVGWTAEPPWA
ncbi:MAG: M14 family zinc carboxypeptidase, partial [Acidobacteriota bacterium]